MVLWETSDLDTPVADLPAFHCYVVHERTVGEPFALAMNQRILQRIAKQEAGFQYLTPQDVGSSLFDWLQNHVPEPVQPQDARLLRGDTDGVQLRLLRPPVPGPTPLLHGLDQVRPPIPGHRELSSSTRSATRSCPAATRSSAGPA